MKIAIASDHAGFERKEQVRKFLVSNGYIVLDCGTFSGESCHYPVFVYSAAQKVTNGDADFAIVICKTGIGSAIVANKVKGVRCGLCHNVESAILTRQHNHSNVLAMGAMFVGRDLAIEISNAFLTTEEESGRHDIRVKLISDIENGIAIDFPEARVYQ